MSRIGYSGYMKYRRAKGCYDIHQGAEEAWKDPSIWTAVENAARSVASLYSLSEIRTPVFESTDVFLRSIGAGSDIVSKEMYTFEDKGGRSLTLRPELTAPAIRAYIENSLYQAGVNRLFYIAPCWRYDRAQKGRYRQFSQFGIEIIGSHDYAADVEAIAALLEFYRMVGLKNLKLLINSIGDAEVRNVYGKALQDHFTPLKDKLSEDSQLRLLKNPLRILDSKAKEDIELAKDAPNIHEFLTDKQKDHFWQVKEALSDLGIEYTVDFNLVRGLDYYCDTVFEVIAETDTAAQNSLGAGGRYDGLIKQMGGQDLPAVGFATGMERVIQNLLSQGNEPQHEEGPDYFLIGLNEKCRKTLLPYLILIRRMKHKALLYQNNFNIKKALTHAEKIQAKFAIILGPEELENGRVKIKNLATREENEYPLSKLEELTNKEDLIKKI